MCKPQVYSALLLALAVILAGDAASAQTRRLPNPVPYAADEPLAETFSLEKGAKYLDVVARFWTKDSCGGCHANHTYLMARPLVRQAPNSAVDETRRFFENRLEQFSKRKGPYRPFDFQRGPKGEIQAPPFFFPAESVGIAVGLALHDAHTAGKLHPTTRRALDHMWDLQDNEQQHRALVGSWGCGCGGFPSVELDTYYAVTLAALAAGVAPEDYAHSARARAGLERLRAFLSRRPARHLHHRAMLLWASLYVDRLMTAAERKAVVQSLLANQQLDGGWNREVLAGGRANHGAPGDGYATGLAVYVLRQAGVPANRPELVRGVKWLRSNQRASGGWFTPSEHAGNFPEAGHGTRELALLNASAAFAVMALDACKDADAAQAPWQFPPVQRWPGLALRSRVTD